MRRPGKATAHAAWNFGMSLLRSLSRMNRARSFTVPSCLYSVARGLDGERRGVHRAAAGLAGPPYRWLRGPATTDIGAPQLRGGHRLTADPTGSSPDASANLDTCGNNMGTEWELRHGNWTGFPGAGADPSWPRT